MNMTASQTPMNNYTDIVQFTVVKFSIIKEEK